MPAKRKRIRRRSEEYDHYLIEVSGWDYSYGFGVDRVATGAHDEHRHLTVHGGLYQPARGDVERVNIFIMGSSADELQREPQDGLPKRIGGVEIHNKILRGYLSVPAERMTELILLVSTGRIRALQLSGTKLKWRKARIHSLMFMTEYDRDTY